MAGFNGENYMETPQKEASLEFQSFDDGAGPGETGGGFGLAEEDPMLVESDDDYNPDAEYPVYRLNFYRKFFNIDGNEIVRRIRRAMIPFRVDFLDSVHSNPDLYGPFWIVTTLVFLVGVCGSIPDRFWYDKDPSGSEFEKISVAASCLYIYHALVPFLLWLYIRTRIDPTAFALVEFICLYGYANAIFVPIAILSVGPNNVWRWLVCCVGLGVSSSVLYQSLAPIVGRNKAHTPVLVAALLAQAGLTIALKLYFFAY